MKKLLYGLLTLAILLGSSYAVVAAPGPGGPGGPGGPAGILPMVLTLGLTDAQKHDVAVLLKKYEAKFEAGMEAMHTALQGLGDVMRSDSGNEKLVREACRKLAAASEELAVLSGKQMAEVKALLTPDQIKRMEEQIPPPPPAPKKGQVNPMRALEDEWINAHAGTGK